MSRDDETLNRYRDPIKGIRRLKNRIRCKIRNTMEFSPYRVTLEYRLELLNVIQSDIKRICAQIDKRHANYANHLNR